MNSIISPNHYPVNREGLVGWWSYRNSGGVAAAGTWKDYSGNGNDATLYGNALVNQNGAVFDRTIGTYMKCSLGAMTTRTFMFNLKLNDYVLYWYDCITNDGSGYQGFILQDNVGDEDSPYLYYSNTGGSAIANFGTLTVGSKTALALTTDGSTISFYQDGVCIASGVSYSHTQSADIYIGSNAGNSRPSAIEIDDIMIFNRILPAGEIKANYLRNKRN